MPRPTLLAVLPVSESPEVLLQVEDVRKAFGGVQAVDGATLTVVRGSLTGLIGPNGAGKSTLIELISGFQRPDSGRVVLDGVNVVGKPPYRISRLGMKRSFQSPREWSELTVMENMMVALASVGRESFWRSLAQYRRWQSVELDDRARARDLLGRFRLLDLRNELAGRLSGGQKRLLEFARLSACQARLVLLDEPQAGVNPVLYPVMAEMIRDMVRAGSTVLMVEHNLEFVESLCDVVYVMALGRTIAHGSMEELRRDAGVVTAYLGEVEPSA